MSKFLIALIIIFGLIFHPSCQKKDLISSDESILRFQKLSEYGIYQGNPLNLVPANDFKLYEVSSQLFTDYAEKQRLVKVPVGTKMSAGTNGLLNFPEGTILVKTFYYFKNKQNPGAGKKLIETRILELRHGKWIAGTYLWNDLQTDALLINTGFKKTINWIDELGNGKVVSYQIPSHLECRTCHNVNKNVQPIGPKVRNLNKDVVRNNTTINQLSYFHNEGILDPVNITSFSSLPDYNDVTKTLEQRARAYLDVNCAHCHSENGFASGIRYRMEYETDMNTSKIKEGKASIKYMMERGDMPKIGTTVVDQKGLELVKEYLETL
ncbi:MAG: hypothetical protein K0S23_326 [Fluviicola sp.]|jgi:uncharacterized repeat protein (TIGR03806 family)|uniref:hypothetical protein n=1 Tax=Fluviicola sp. TaxID=1917219 RepID=UPI00262E0E2A|nr:hypothetical protein [Fluviicola sp.]MDF3026019.1 hypothetical protein [Fluviicola sp.]